MKYSNGMWLNGKPNQNPLNSTRANRNIVYDRSTGSITNENGNVFIENFGSDKRPIGIITLDSNDFIVFSKSSENDSTIGYVDENLHYTQLKSDPLLGFKSNKPIHGEFQRALNGDIIIAFTDGDGTFKYLNITKEGSTSVADMNVFANFNKPTVVSSILYGGNLKSGAWYPIIQYEKYDRSTTSWIKNYSPVFIAIDQPIEGSYNDMDKRAGKIPNTTTNLSIKLDFTNLDTRFKRLRIGMVFQANNIKLAYYIRTIDITSATMSAVISSMEELSERTLPEVIVDKANYKSVEHLVQYENTLYAAGLLAYSESIDQTKINNIQLKFKSTLVDFGAQPIGFRDHFYNNRTKHFQHGEVYAIYVRFRFPWGFGQWRHLPGRVSTTGERTPIVVGNESFLNFQVNDTCDSTGKLSYWENQDEDYPLIGNFPSGKVRHIKFPTIKWMKANVYNGQPLYGSSKLDILNLQVVPSSINLSDFRDCDGNVALSYEIGYAKRGEGEGLVQGQTIFVAGADFTNDSVDNILTSMGMNASYTGEDDNALALRLDNLRTYDYGMLFNKRTSSITHIRSEVILKANLTLAEFREPDYDYEYLRRGIAQYYKEAAQVSTETTMPVIDSTFIINNTVKKNINNTYLEDTIALKLTTPLALPFVKNINTATNWGTFLNYTHLITLLSIRRNCYSSFTNQSIVVCDEIAGSYGGDTSINISSITTFGTTTQRGNDTDPTSNDKNTPYNGTRIAHVFLSESKLNIGLRYVNPATLGGSTKFAPHDDAVEYLPRLRRDQEPNLLIQGYSTDYNALNDLEFGDIYNPIQEGTRIIDRPFESIRSEPITNSDSISQWIDFKVNNTYKLDRTKGKLINFVAGKEYLIFHHEHAMLITRTTNYLDASGEAVFVGTGDVFESIPKEVIHSKLGALGTQHKYSCYMSEYGYIFYDAEKARWCIFDGQPKIISNGKMDNFFKEFGFNPGDNPFTSNGWSIALDEDNLRFIITKKHQKLKAEYQKKYKGIWRNDKKFLSSLKKDDIIYKDGRYQFVN